MIMRVSVLLRAALTVLLGAGVVICVGTPAGAAPSREEIFARLKVDQVPADYVVLVDTSGSMAGDGLYANVKATLRTFLTGLTATDHVALFTFDSTPTPRYNGPGGDPGRIVASLPDVPSDNKTDIGAAIQKAVEELERRDAAPVASVVLITDGAQDPPAGSPYPATTDADAWRGLAARASRLKAQSVTGYALPLTRDGATGAAMLGFVIESTDVLDPNGIADLGAYLDRSKERTRLGKARLALANDVGKGVTASWSVPPTADVGSGDVALTMTLRSDAVTMPLTVSGLSARASGGPTLVGDVPVQIELQPGESRTFELRLAWRPEPWLVPYRQTKLAEVPLHADGTVTSGWAAALEPDILLDVPPAVAGPDARPTVTAQVGTWYAQAGTAAVVIVLALVLLTLFVRRRPLQTGTLVAMEPMTGREQARFPLRGRRTRLVGQGLQGEGQVVAQRVPRGHTNQDGLEYVIRYRRAEYTSTSSLPSRGAVLVNGINFEHVVDEPDRPARR